MGWLAIWSDVKQRQAGGGRYGSKAGLYDVYTEMLRDIQTGLYPENSLFPPEEKLCRKYNASRSTLRRALNMLKETGVLYSVQGNGTYIKPFVFTQPYLILLVYWYA